MNRESGGQDDRRGHPGGEDGMAMKSLSGWQSAAWIAFSFAVLFSALWLTDRWVPIRFTAGG
jgi:hypothetical protein